MLLHCAISNWQHLLYARWKISNIEEVIEFYNSESTEFTKYWSHYDQTIQRVWSDVIRSGQIKPDRFPWKLLQILLWLIIRNIPTRSDRTNILMIEIVSWNSNFGKIIYPCHFFPCYLVVVFPALFQHGPWYYWLITFAQICLWSVSASTK